MRLLRWTVVGVGVIASILTLLPLLDSPEAWIRIWDFPRVQLAAILAGALVAGVLVLRLRRPSTLAFLTALAGMLAIQLVQIWPYTPVASVQAAATASCAPESRLRLIIANVLYENRDAQPLLDLLAREEPDLVLLVETTQWWDEQLAPLQASYPGVVRHPLEDGHGMHLFSRFALVDPQVRFLIEDYLPSIRTGVVLPSGANFLLYGVHPMPPPLDDTERRDAELLIVGREVRQSAAPSIVAGDLNEVSWSETTRLFQEVSGLLDPRLGRGTYATFNANWPLLRWPLDQVFFDESFLLLELRVLEHIGSDHFPLFVAVCHAPAAAAVQPEPRPEADDLEEAADKIEEGKEEAEE